MIPAFPTEASKYAEEQYAKQNCLSKVKINVKKEHTIENLQKLCEQKIPVIVFGYGDLKAKKCKKTSISYICLLDENYKPIWSYIIPSK